MIRIFKEDEEFDLIGDESIPITYQSNTPEKPDSFQSNYSINFDLPDTPKNQRLIGYSNIRTFVSLLPYRLISIRIVSDGIEIAPNATIVIKKIKRKKLGKIVLECQIFEGNINFFDILGDKTIQELDLSAYNHPYTPTEIQASQLYDYTDGYVYDIYRRGQIDDLFSNTYQNLSPSIFARIIWDRIFFESGFAYSFTDGVPTIPHSFNNILIPFVNKTRPIQAQNKEFAKGSSGKIEMVNGYGVPAIGLLGEVVVEFDGSTYPKNNTQNSESITVLGGSYINSEYTLHNLAPKILVKVDISIHFTSAVNTGSPNGIVSLIRIDASNVRTVIYSEPAPNGSVIDYTFKYSAFVELLLGDSISITYSVASNGSFFVDKGSFKTEVIDNEALVSGIWEVAPNLPKIKQKDFIKNLMHIYGLFPQIDNWTKVIKIAPFNKVKITANALDFTSKIDEKQSTTSFVFTDFAQNNYFNYLEDEDIVKDYSGVLIVDNETIAFSKDVLTLVFAPIENLLEAFNSLKILNFEIQDETVTDAKLAKYKNNESKPRLSIDVAASNEPFDLFEDFNFAGTPITISNPRRSAFEDMEFQNLLDLNWQTYTSILDSCQREEIYLIINETDIQNLDFSKAVWLGADFQGYYYLSKIVQYKDSKESVLCEMYRLNQLS
jgi:hypothetical protein